MTDEKKQSLTELIEETKIVVETKRSVDEAWNDLKQYEVFSKPKEYLLQLAEHNRMTPSQLSSLDETLRYIAEVELIDDSELKTKFTQLYLSSITEKYQSLNRDHLIQRLMHGISILYCDGAKARSDESYAITAEKILTELLKAAKTLRNSNDIVKKGMAEIFLSYAEAYQSAKTS